MKITIKDIAKELNLHHSTVSRALSGNTSIPNKTAKRVLDMADKLGYVQNSLASEFKTNKSRNVAVIVPTIKHFFFADIIAEFSELVNEYGYRLLIFQSGEDEKLQSECIKSAISARATAIFISMAINTKDYNIFKDVEKQNIDLFFFDRCPNIKGVNSVIVDNYKGAYDAVNYLIKRGNKKIANITGALDINVYKERLNGYKDAIEDASYKIPNEIIIEGGFSQKDGVDGVIKIFQVEKPDAILAVGDKVAIGAIYQLKKMGYRVPEDIAVIGFDNDPVGEYFNPSLTTVCQNQNLLAKNVFQLFLRKQGEVKESHIIPVVPKLIIRDSA